MPADPTEDELDTIIRRLNENYDLGIRRPDGRRLLESEEQARVDDIYQRIRVLHFGKGDQLSCLLGRFHANAYQALTRPVRSSFGLQSPTLKKPDLQRLLLDVLTAQPSKRPSDEQSISRGKRARSVDKGSVPRGHAVDKLPVRTRINGLGSGSVAPSRPNGGVKPYLLSTPDSMQSSSPSTPSFTDSIFSVAQAPALASSDTSLDEDATDQSAAKVVISEEYLQASANRRHQHIGSFFDSRPSRGLKQRLQCTWRE